MAFGFRAWLSSLNISQTYCRTLSDVQDFNQRFPTSAVAWSISPEARTSRGDYVDLLIARNTFDPFEAHPTIVYEGKSAHGDPWDKIRSQLWAYAVTYVRRNGQFIYMVGARGTGCRFFRYKKGDLWNGRAWSIKARPAGCRILRVVMQQHMISRPTKQPSPALWTKSERILPLCNAVEFDTEHLDVQADVEVGSSQILNVIYRTVRYQTICKKC
ncbi:hypothetical protein BJV77DRAFT_130952 [Russula vinacea]|nr:hypothetical protein BJV77DRAFT_130952 [Russula vinacea]